MVIGTMVQQTYDTLPKLRAACEDNIFTHASHVEADIREAKAKHCPNAKFDPRSLAAHTQAVLQGAFILAKATGNPQRAMESIDNLKTYVQLLFKNPILEGKAPA